ncbi:MAG: NAD(+) kinase [Gammaproteobacteria bacterium]|nr:NAD(+) kinase [Gammaproteobacteria bacterium]
MFKRIGLIAKTNHARAHDTLGALVSYLDRRGMPFLALAGSEHLMPPGTAPTVDYETLGTQCDLAIVVGGDGTLLRAARALVDHDVRLLGINLGRLGFLADVLPDDMEQRLDEILDGRFLEEPRLMLDTVVRRNGAIVEECTSLNDAVVHKWQFARLIEFEMYIDGIFVNRQRSDGIIIATPTGSTAYALSGGGPILHPTLDTLVLVPICPHTLSNRPIVVAAASRVEMIVHSPDRDSAMLTCDGRNSDPLKHLDEIAVSAATRRLRVIHPAGHDHYAVLRTKLHWGQEFYGT